MSHRALYVAALWFCCVPDGPPPDPDPPAPEFVVTRADVERLLADARGRETSLLDPFGVEHPLMCWQHDCLAAASSSATHGIWQEGDPEKPGAPTPPADQPAPQDPSEPVNPTPDPAKPFDPAKYEYPFPSDAPESVVDLLRKADAKRKAAERKPPQLDQFEESNALYDAATKTGPGLAYAYYHIARNCQSILEWKLAREAIDKALKLDPKSPHLWTEDGDIHTWQADREKALKSFERALALDPKFVPAYTSRAGVRQQRHEWALAKADIEKAVEIEPTAEGFKDMLKQLDVELNNMGFVGDGVSVKDTAHYRIYSHDKGLANLIAAHAEAIYSYYTERFPKASLGGLKFAVYLFADQKSFQAAGGRPGTAGYYNPNVRKLVLPVNSKDQQRRNAWKPGQPPDAGRLENTLIVLYHEGFHQFLHYSLEKAPQWFNEGHGDYYGGARWDAGKKRPNGGIGYFNIGLMDWRVGYIKQRKMFASANGYEDLPRLMQMTQGEFYMPQIVGRNYSQSWSMVHFLHTRNDIGQTFLIPYYKELRKGNGLRTAFEATFGRTDMGKFEDMWVEFAKAKHK